MKTKILIFSLLFTFSAISAQDINESANALKSNKQLKREKKDAEEYQQYLATGQFLDSMRFVLKAEYLSNNTGFRNMVEATLNFILVDSLNGTIQTGTMTGMGRNGVGGSTATGNITGWKITKNDKKKSYLIKMDLSTNLGFYTIFMTVYSNAKASATLTGMGRGSLTFDGPLVPLKKSRVFKGNSGF